MKKKNQSQEKTGKEGRADYRGFRQTLDSPDKRNRFAKEKVRDDSTENDSLKSLDFLEMWLQRTPIISRVTGERRLTIKDYSDLRDFIKSLEAENIILTSILKQKKFEVMKIIDNFDFKYYSCIVNPIHLKDIKIKDLRKELKSRIDGVFE